MYQKWTEAFTAFAKTVRVELRCVPVSTSRCLCSLTSCARLSWLALIWQGPHTPVSVRAHSWRSVSEHKNQAAEYKRCLECTETGFYRRDWSGGRLQEKRSIGGPDKHSNLHHTEIAALSLFIEFFSLYNQQYNWKRGSKPSEGPSGSDWRDGRIVVQETDQMCCCERVLGRQPKLFSAIIQLH